MRRDFPCLSLHHVMLILGLFMSSFTKASQHGNTEDVMSLVHQVYTQQDKNFNTMFSLLPNAPLRPPPSAIRIFPWNKPVEYKLGSNKRVILDPPPLDMDDNAHFPSDSTKQTFSPPLSTTQHHDIINAPIQLPIPENVNHKRQKKWRPDQQFYS